MRCKIYARPWRAVNFHFVFSANGERIENHVTWTCASRKFIFLKTLGKLLISHIEYGAIRRGDGGVVGWSENGRARRVDQLRVRRSKIHIRLLIKSKTKQKRRERERKKKLWQLLKGSAATSARRFVILLHNVRAA